MRQGDSELLDAAVERVAADAELGRRVRHVPAAALDGREYLGVVVRSGASLARRILGMHAILLGGGEPPGFPWALVVRFRRR